MLHFNGVSRGQDSDQLCVVSLLRQRVACCWLGRHPSLFWRHALMFPVKRHFPPALGSLPATMTPVRLGGDIGGTGIG